MQEKLKAIPKRILEWWNKFSMKQKLVIIGVVAGVLAVVIITAVALTRPTYTELTTCESTKEASEIVTLLEEESLKYEVSEDGLRIKILKGQLSQAKLLLGENGIPTTSYDLDTALSGGLSTTEADKQKKYVLYKESDMETDLEAYSFVKNAIVDLHIPEDDGTLISSGVESSASVCLELSGEMTADNAQAMARFIATALGNSTTDNIVIMDSEGNMYFSGTEDVSAVGTASSQLTVKQQTENAVSAQVKEVLNGTGEFSLISVAPNLSLDFSTTEITDKKYTPADGQTQGVLASEDHYSSESTSGSGGIPGTDSNGEQGTTSYVIDENGTSSETIEEYSRQYLPNERVENQKIPAGLVKYSDSSIAVTTIHYNVIKQEDAQSQGLLDGISWSEYKTANSGRTKLDIDEELVSVVANATGIPAANISFIAYSENMFLDKEASSVNVADIAQVVLIIVILALLAFVVLRSMRGEKQLAEEEELSVENLLQSTPQDELEDIALEEKSETRKLIEKFVDDNPEAAANLLRNWLNEDWG